MIDQIVRDARSAMDDTIKHFRDDIAAIHSGRASAGLVEDIKVDHYGSTMQIKQIASITTPDATSISISPWDKGALTPIETAIRESGIGINPINDGAAIRIVFPPPSQERRQELVRLVSEKAEHARVALRQAREDAWRKVQDGQREGSITEDDKYRAEKQLNTTIDEFNEAVKSIVVKKEQEITSM